MASSFAYVCEYVSVCAVSVLCISVCMCVCEVAGAGGGDGVVGRGAGGIARAAVVRRLIYFNHLGFWILIKTDYARVVNYLSTGPYANASQRTHTHTRAAVLRARSRAHARNGMSNDRF